MNCLMHAILCSTALCSRPAQSAVVQQFQPHACESYLGRLPYQLYRPGGKARKLPLLVWLHGYGEAGVNNQDQLAWLELLIGATADAQPFPALILAVQCPPDLAHWGRRTELRADGLLRLEMVVEDVCRRYAVDLDRIILAGISQGATACWEYARRHPGRFAGLAVMGTNEVPNEVALAWCRTPIWAFQSEADGDRRVRAMTDLITALKQNGGSVRLTVVPTDTHDCWSAAFHQYGLAHWLLAQTRTTSTSLARAARQRLRATVVVGLVSFSLLLGALRIFLRRSRYRV